jgi:hypothetical protein
VSWAHTTAGLCTRQAHDAGTLEFGIGTYHAVCVGRCRLQGELSKAAEESALNAKALDVSARQLKLQEEEFGRARDELGVALEAAARKLVLKEEAHEEELTLLREQVPSTSQLSVSVSVRDPIRRRFV